MQVTVVQALNQFREIVTKQNHYAVTRLVEYAASEPYHPDYLEGVPEDKWEEEIEETEEEIAEMRLNWIILRLGDRASEMIQQPRDVLTHWETYSVLTGLNGAAFDNRDPAERERKKEEYLRGLRDGLRALGGDAATLELPEEFVTLLEHADTLEGNGWDYDADLGSRVVFFSGLVDYERAVQCVCSAEALKGGSAYAWGEEDQYRDFVHVVAGWECGWAPEGACHIIYGTEKEGGKPGWHYHVNLGQFGSRVFTCLYDLLKWYQEYNIPDDYGIEQSFYDLWFG